MCCERGLFVFSSRVSAGGSLEVTFRNDKTRQMALDVGPMLDLVRWGSSGELTRLVPGEVNAECSHVGSLDGVSQGPVNDVF